MASPVVVKILGDSKGLSTALTGAKAQLEAFRLSTNKTAMLAGGALTGLAVVGGLAIKEAFDLDQIQRDFATSTGLIGDDLDQAMSEVLDAAGRVPDSFEAVGEAAGNLQTSTGFLGDSLEDLTVQFLDINRLGFGALNENQVGELINNWGLSAEEAGDTFDMLAQVSQATGADIGMMADLVTSNGGAFREMGLDVEDSLALIGQWEKAGIDVNKAVRGLNSNLDMLQDRGEDTDAMFAMLTATMDDGVISAEEATNMYDLFGAEATDLISALESGAITLDDFTGSVGLSGQSVEEMATANASLGEKFSELKNKIMAEVAPALLQLADGITVMVDWLLSDGIPAFQRFGSQLADVLGPILVNLKDTFVTVFGIIRDTWELFSAFFEGDWDEVWTNVKEIFAGMWDLVVLSFERAVETLKLVWAGFKAAFGEAVEATVDLVVGLFTGLWDSITGLFNDGVAGVVAVVTGIGSGISSFFSNAWSTVSEAVGEFWGHIEDAATGAKDWIGEKLDEVVDFFTGLPARVVTATAGAFDGLKDSFFGVLGAIVDAWNNIDFEISISIPGWVPGIGGRGWNSGDVFPDIPNPFASSEGGIFTKPTLTWVGEAGPEAIVPFDQMPQGNTAPGASPLPALGGGGDVNVFVETDADPREVGAAVAWALATGGA
jgi:phage-related minor tail protein